MVQKHIISRDDRYYHAFPDVALTPSGRLVCVISECTHHGDRSYTRIALRDSVDRGRTWSEKRYLTGGTEGLPYWNCPRISTLRDGRLVAVADSIGTAEHHRCEYDKLLNYLFFSSDEGRTWSDPVLTPAQGIVPDKLRELQSGRWLLSCHVADRETGFLTQRLWHSDNSGVTWQGPVTVGRKSGLNLCEGSILEVEPGVLVAFHRENSFAGWDCFKTVSRNQGESWSEPVGVPPAGLSPAGGRRSPGRAHPHHASLHAGRQGFGSARGPRTSSRL